MAGSRSGPSIASVILGAALAVLSPYSATARAFDLADLEGRWKADGRDLVLDVTPCGQHFCAVLVRSDETCGSVAMRMDKMDRGAGEDLILEGRLDVPGESGPYERTILQPGFDPDGNAVMDVSAHDKLHFETRDYAFAARLMRTGPAVCHAGPTS